MLREFRASIVAQAITANQYCNWCPFSYTKQVVLELGSESKELSQT
jgi:hypothetical protein